jgi:hypothetical protein
LAEAEWIADRYDRITDRGLLGGSQAKRGQWTRRHFEQRGIGCGIGSNDVRRHFPRAREPNSHRASAHNDVTVGSDEALCVDDESRPQH